MKILIVGEQKGWAIEHHYVRYMAPYAEVEVYAAEEVFNQFYWKSPFNKIRFKLGLSKIQQQIGKELLLKAESFRPDIIWVFKGMRLLPVVLKQLKTAGFKLANYNPDHPFIFSSQGSGNQNVTDGIGLYDLHVCYSYSVAERIQKEYGIQTTMLPFGFELSETLFEGLEQVEEINKACFIGNPDPIRAAFLESLAASGVALDVYGHGWNKYLSPTKNLTTHDATYKEDFWKKMRAYRVQINIFRPHNEGSHNMRTFEIPAVGGIMLAPDSKEHREFFKEGEEAFFYKDKEEMIQAVKRILALDQASANLIRQRARARSVEGGYDYKGRAAWIAKQFAVFLKKEITIPV